MENTVTVTGVGRVPEAPDVAQIDVTLGVDRPDPSQAYTEVDDVARRVIAVLDEQAVAPADRQTRTVSLLPRHDYSASAGEPRVVGYRATITLAVRILRLDAVPTVLDALVATAGEALRLDHLALTSSDPDGARREAEVAAVADARERAQRLAVALGATLGPVLALRQDVAEGPHPLAPAPRVAAMGASIEAGENTVTATVGVTFALVR